MEKADLLHLKMLEAPASKMFTQDELMALVAGTDLAGLLAMTQSLIDRKMMKLAKLGDELRFQAISAADTRKLTSMTDDEQMIYSHIEASGREGIWTKTLKAKTNMHQHVVQRCLKSLELNLFIKLIKSVKHPTRKIYMLYNLQPSIEVTGGPWFTDSELDTEFIDSLLTVVWRFVASETFPTVFRGATSNTNVFSSVYPSNYPNFPTLDSIMDFITSHKVTNIDLSSLDIRSLCDVLIYDDMIEIVKGTVDVYRATWQSVLEAGYGRQYAEEGMLEGEQKAFAERLDKEKVFCLFDYYGVISEDVRDEDVLYLDSWMYN